MQAIGCYEAINLDDGTSVALAHKVELFIPARHNLTKVIVIYDSNNPAPVALKTAWDCFQKGNCPKLPCLRG